MYAHVAFGFYVGYGHQWLGRLGGLGRLRQAGEGLDALIVASLEGWRLVGSKIWRVVRLEV